MSLERKRFNRSLLATTIFAAVILIVPTILPALGSTPVPGFLGTAVSVQSTVEVDSNAIFAADIESVLRTMMSYHDSVMAPADLSAESLVGYLSPVARQRISPETFNHLESLVLLTRGLELDSLNGIASSLVSDEVERVRMGSLMLNMPLTIPVDATITSSFGMRNHPILRGRRMHAGLDMAAPSGTSIFAPGGGTVIFSGRKNGYGNTLIIDHGDGYTTLYGHCSRLLVEEGAKVSRGDMIALVGSTGRSTGPHLHYEVRLNNQPLNPEAFLLYQRDRIEQLESIALSYLTI